LIVSNPGRLILMRIAQAQQEHDEAKEVFDMLNDQLVAELPQLMDLRVPYFDPSFEAMIRMQSKFAEEGYEKLSGVQRYFADSIRDDYAAGQLDAQVSVLFHSHREHRSFQLRSRVSFRRCENCPFVVPTNLVSFNCNFFCIHTGTVIHPRSLGIAFVHCNYENVHKMYSTGCCDENKNDSHKNENLATGNCPLTRLPCNLLHMPL
jgi:hypothetical protein